MRRFSSLKPMTQKRSRFPGFKITAKIRIADVLKIKTSSCLACVVYLKASSKQ